jgi:hypothetical protein
MKPIVFWQPKLMHALERLFNRDDATEWAPALRYVVVLDPTEIPGSLTSYDDIMRLCVFPHNLHREKSLAEVLNMLVTEQNQFPLYVQVAADTPLAPNARVVFTISQRFRRWKDIQQWHRHHELAPFRLPDQTATG